VPQVFPFGIACSLLYEQLLKNNAPITATITMHFFIILSC